MTLTLELATFTIRQGSGPALVEERPETIEALRRAVPAALAAWLTRQDDGSWLDVSLWRSRPEAEDAARRIDEVPEAKRWFRQRLPGALQLLARRGRHRARAPRRCP